MKQLRKETLKSAKALCLAGVKKGTTTIYVYSRNGYTKKIKVTVK